MVKEGIHTRIFYLQKVYIIFLIIVVIISAIRAYIIDIKIIYLIII